MKPTAAEERAGPIGTKMAKDIGAKLRGAIDGFPASNPEQKSAIASLVAEDMEKFSDELL